MLLKKGSGLIAFTIEQAAEEAKTASFNKALAAYKKDWARESLADIKRSLEEIGYKVSVIHNTDNATQKNHGMQTDATLEYNYAVAYFATDYSSDYRISASASISLIDNKKLTPMLKTRVFSIKTKNQYKNIDELIEKADESSKEIGSSITELTTRISQHLNKERTPNP